MPDVLIRADLDRAPHEQEQVPHNRWHPTDVFAAFRRACLVARGSMARPG